jgi:c-di-GMP-binding flagellar brake protein YcgR
MEAAYPEQDRREFRRQEVSFIVIYRVNTPLFVRMLVKDKEVDALALDLSEGGMAILTSYELAISTLVTLKFIIFKDLVLNMKRLSESVEATGEVRYSVFTKEKAYRIGIRFTDISSEDRNLIATFAKR